MGAPYTTTAQGPGVTTIHQQAPVVTKQVHYGTTDFVSGYTTAIHKPPTPHLPISVPTVLKGSVAYNAPIVKEQIEVHNVQNPVHVEAPYNVPVPVAVQGETIVKHTKAAPVVTHSQHHVNAGVVGVEHAGYAGVAGYAGIPAAGLVH